jgi:hypothetical protein
VRRSLALPQPLHARSEAKIKHSVRKPAEKLGSTKSSTHGSIPQVVLRENGSKLQHKLTGDGTLLIAPGTTEIRIRQFKEVLAIRELILPPSLKTIGTEAREAIYVTLFDWSETCLGAAVLYRHVRVMWVGAT